MQTLVEENRETLLATKDSVAEILKQVKATGEAVDRIEPVVSRIDCRLERLARLAEARPVSEALKAGAILEQEQDDVLGVLNQADPELTELLQALSPESVFQLGLVYAADGRFDNARLCFAAVTERKPDMADAYSGLAMIYQLHANALIGEENFGLAAASLERAKAYADTALQYDSTDSGVLNQMGYTEKELAQRYTAAEVTKPCAGSTRRARTSSRRWGSTRMTPAHTTAWETSP